MHRATTLFAPLLLGVAALLPSVPARATGFCVTTSVQLQGALDQAENNDDVDEIRIAAGDYVAPPDGFVYDAESIAGGDHQNITISGGWSGPAFDRCRSHQKDPSLTVLHGNGGRVMELRIRNFTSVHVSLITFQGGNSSSFGGGLLIENLTAVGHLRDAFIERNVFVNNVAQVGGGLAYRNDGSGALHVVNNQFRINHANGIGGAGYFYRYGDGARIFVINNTVLQNTSSALGPIEIGGFEVFYADEAWIVNNNLWGNDGADISVSGDTTLALLNNNFASRVGAEPFISIGNISVTPEYEFTFLNQFTPVRNSPLVDAGALPPPDSGWELSDYDLKGEARIVGPTVDIGAYENERIFNHDFEVGPGGRLDDPHRS